MSPAHRTPTRGGGRRRRRRETMSAPRTLSWAAGVLAVVGAFFWIAATAYNGVPFKTYKMVTLNVPEAGSLQPHDPVRIGGIQVGQVRKLRITTDGRAELTLALEPGTALSSDTQAQIRANGLLGARFVQLIPGRSHTPLPAHAVIRGSAGSLTYGLPEALTTFDPATRAALGGSIRGLGGGLAGQGGAVNDLLKQGSAQIVPFEQIVGTVEARGDAAQHLLPSLDSVLTPLDASRVAYGKLLSPIASGLSPFVTQRSATRDGLTLAPGTFDAARSGLTAGTGLLGAARSVAVEANTTLARAPSGLRSTAALLRVSQVPLDRTRDVLHRVTAAAPATRKLVSSAAPLLSPLRAAADELTPATQVLGEHGCDIENFGGTLRSMTGFGATDETGGVGQNVFFRLQLVLAPQETASVADPTTKRDAYPAPCAYLSKPYSTLQDPLATGKG